VKKATRITPTVIGSIEKVSISNLFPTCRSFSLPTSQYLKTELIGHIGMADPIGGFAWRAGAVVDCDECLNADVGGDGE